MSGTNPPRHQAPALLSLLLLLAATPIMAGAQQAGGSLVWGDWPAVPWDTIPVEDDAFARLLDRPIDLGRRGMAGEERRYHIRRTNLSLDRHGRVLNRVITEGEFVRILEEMVGSGDWAVSFRWTWFASGTALGADSHPVPTEVPSAEGLSYRMVPGESDYVNPPADFGAVTDELQGVFLKILAVDATSFDALLRTLRDELGDSVHVGSVARARPPAERFALRSSDESEQPTWYHLGEMRVAVAGLSRLGGEPTALVRFSVEGSRVIQNLQTAQLTMTSEGTEYFRGVMSVSLIDGRIVAGSLWGPVLSVVALGFGGQTPSEQPTAAFMQQVTLTELPR